MSAIHLLDVPAVRTGHARTSVLQSIRADGCVQGLLFELTVEQTYLNTSEDNIEAVYTFPVTWDAVLLSVECVLGDKVLQGVVVAKADGERRYEAALEEGNAAVMVERAGDGMYTANVGNLLPGERAIVRFRYAQLLSFAQGHIRLVVPTTIGPRYGNPRTVGLQPHQIPRNDILADYPFSLNIVIQGEVANAVLSSPSHALSMQSRDGSVSLSLAEGTRLDRDVVVVAQGLTGKSITTLGRDVDGYVALASFCPSERDRPRDTPLNLKILVDCSGSMNGDRIDAARRALHDVLSHLEPEDNFSFSCFGSDIKHLSVSLMAATPRAIKKASDWVATVQADMGGTEIAEALLSTYALAQPFDADILLVTDGDVWEADRLIASATQAGQRIFAVGIGSAPASSLLQALAKRTGGACECVTAHTEIPGAVLRMFRRMRQAPVRDVTVTWKEQPRWQSSPGRVVLSGETVHHVAGFAQHVPTSATLSWGDSDGNTRQESVTINDTVVDGLTLARVAAAMRLAEVTPAERHGLALQYGLVSATTNLVLVHERAEADKPDQLPGLHQVAHAIPAGWGGLGTSKDATFAHVGASTLRASRHAGVGCGPAVWRKEQSAAMFRVEQPQDNRYDIPAFLRKQAPADAYLYRDALRCFLETQTIATAQHGTDQVPSVLLDDIAAQLPEEVIEKLRQLIDAGFSEADVIRAFVAALTKYFRDDGIAKRIFDIVQRLATRGNATALERRIQTIVLEAVDARSPARRDEIPAWLRRAAD
jgi:Ca-activated chloride channel family protein